LGTNVELVAGSKVVLRSTPYSLFFFVALTQNYSSLLSGHFVLYKHSEFHHHRFLARSVLHCTNVYKEECTLLLRSNCFRICVKLPKTVQVCLNLQTKNARLLIEDSLVHCEHVHLLSFIETVGNRCIHCIHEIDNITSHFTYVSQSVMGAYRWEVSDVSWNRFVEHERIAKEISSHFGGATIIFTLSLDDTVL
jgi:hypothetical protein